jgi:uncharacterized membrane protein
MSWLTLTILAQFLNSIVALFDKYLVTSKKVTTPVLYVFYTGVLTFLGILVYVPSLFMSGTALPRFSNVGIPSAGVLALILIAAFAQLGALHGLFSALKKNDASDVMPVVGSFSAIFALVIGFMFQDLVLPSTFVFGFTLLVIGTLHISHLRFTRRIFLFTMLGGLGFALHNILLKMAIHATSFDTGFFWFSVLTTIVSFGLLAFPVVRRTLTSQRKERHIKSTGAILLFNKLLAGVAGILLIKAIEIGEVSLVQALGGLQFFFLFILAMLLGPITPIDFGENVRRKDLYHKLTSISIIFVGFVLLFI